MKFEEEESAMCERLNCKNYRVWALRMKMILIKDLWDIIVPESSKPEDAVRSLKALAHIVFMVDNDQLVHVSDAKGGKKEAHQVSSVQTRRTCQAELSNVEE
ncbi:hypothetical protein ACKWTF_001944 [Chironomus riparius]